MNDPLFDADDAATPLTQDEKQGLIPSPSLTTNFKTSLISIN